MKMKLKLAAVAAALVSLAGGARADLTPPNSPNGSLALVVFDTVTRDWYMRDLGFLMNSFLPSSVTTFTGDGGGSAVTGDKTPDAGLTLNGGNTTNFGSDATFTTWLASHTAANVRWMVSASDQVGVTTGVDVPRLIASSANASETATNSQVTNYTSSGLAGGLGTFFNPGGLSKTGTGDAASAWDNNFGLGADGLASLDQAVNLFYFTRTTGTGSSTGAATGGAYGNSANLATLLFTSAGELTYALAPAVAAVPLPTAALLLGGGLLAMGGRVRRRAAAAAA